MFKQNKKRKLGYLRHLSFWIISVIFWNNIAFIPSVGGLRISLFSDYSLMLTLVYIAYSLYTFLPATLFLKGISKQGKLIYIIIFTSVTILFSLHSFFPNPVGNSLSELADIYIHNFLYTIIFHFSIIGAVYFNLEYLIKNFLNQGKFILYVIFIISLIGVSSILNYALFDFVIDVIFPKLLFISYFKIWELLLIHALYISFSTTVFLIWQYVILLKTNRENIQNQLVNLKAQINPHFLFNNLNTIYFLASKNDKKTKDVILRLSDFLRYVLYDTTSEMIMLEKEIDSIKAFIELQMERLDPKLTEVEFRIEGSFTGYEIAPLLLLPIAENCFKHGIGKKYGKIIISLAFDGKQLIFNTENPISPREKNRKYENGGIGISNVEKRLALLYPDRHLLKYGETGDNYKVELTIQLK